MLKLLALDDRYRNIRGPEEAPHAREEAGTHAADIVAVLSAQLDPAGVRERFQAQFGSDPLLGIRVLRTADKYFRLDTSPGLLVYEEHLVSEPQYVLSSRRELQIEIGRAHGVMSKVLPSLDFVALIAAVADSCEIGSSLAQEFLASLEENRISMDDPMALQLLPRTALGGAYSALSELAEAERSLVRHLLRTHAARLGAEATLRAAFPHALGG